MDWSEGWRPLGAAVHSPDEPSEQSQWPGHDDSNINVVVIIVVNNMIVISHLMLNDYSFVVISIEYSH